MIQKIFQSFGSLGIHLFAVVILWVLVGLIGYALARWCFEYDVSLHKMFKAISVAMAGLFGLVGLVYLLPDALRIPLVHIIIPRIMCAVVLHSLLLASDRYMRHRSGKGIIPARLLIALVAVYAFSFASAVLLLRIDNQLLTTLADIAVDYITKIGLFGLLALEIISGRCSTSDAIEPR